MKRNYLLKSKIGYIEFLTRIENSVEKLLKINFPIINIKNKNYNDETYFIKRIKKIIVNSIDGYNYPMNTKIKLIDNSKLTIFSKTVLFNMDIPFGKVITYKLLSEKIFNCNKSRAIGGVMRRNPFPLLFPCHRVICSDLSIGNYSSGGIDMKRKLLGNEGIKFDSKGKILEKYLEDYD